MSSPIVFDTTALHRQRERRAAGLMADAFLLDEIHARLVDRLDDIKRRFARVLDLGARHGALARALRTRDPETEVVSAEPAPTLARHAPAPTVVSALELLPFADHAFDAVMSAGSLHLVNDLPGALVQMRRALEPDGLLLVAFPGGDTLVELRRAFTMAEAELTGGASPRVAPFVDVRDLGGLLQRAGFALPVVDVDRLTLTYAHPLALLADLRRAGEANVLAERSRRTLRRDVLMAMAERYLADERDARGRIRVTVDVLFATAWAPHASQPQPKRRGSGSVNLARAMGVDPAILEGEARREDGDGGDGDGAS
ncbi:MAG: class I SAM-dependent methyltransferase [Alphaproteobacteria bacterium]